jgi:hypothetical protein
MEEARLHVAMSLDWFIVKLNYDLSFLSRFQHEGVALRLIETKHFDT